MFSRLARHLIDAWKSQFKLGSEGKCRIFCYVNRRRFTSMNGLVMEDNPQNTSGAALVAVCQMNSTNDVNRNLGICKDLVKKAKSRGAKVKLINKQIYPRKKTPESTEAKRHP